MLCSTLTRAQPIPPISRPLCKRRSPSWLISTANMRKCASSWNVGQVLRPSSSGSLSSLRHAIIASANRSCSALPSYRSGSKAQQCSKLVRFIDPALVSAPLYVESVLVGSVTKEQDKHDLSRLIVTSNEQSSPLRLGVWS